MAQIQRGVALYHTKQIHTLCCTFSTLQGLQTLGFYAVSLGTRMSNRDSERDDKKVALLTSDKKVGSEIVG